MAFLIDLDLLRLEPSTFIDAPTIGTELESGSDGQVLSSTFTSQSSSFISRGVAVGSVIIVGDDAFEIVSVTDEKTLSVSRARADDADPLIPPPPGSNLSFPIITFARVIDLVQAWALGRLGLDLDDEEADLDETAVTNPAPLKRLLIVQSVRRIFENAAAQTPTDDSLLQRAALYKTLAEAASAQTEVHLDLDGDGLADTTRRFDVLTLHRS